MKLYDKEALLMVILDFGLIAFTIWNFYYYGPAIHNVAILLYACDGFRRNIKYAFVEEDSKQKQIELEKQKVAYKNVFRKFAPFAPFSFFIFLGLGLLFLKLLPGRMLGIYVIIFGLFSPMLVDTIVSTERHRMETEQE